MSTTDRTVVCTMSPPKFFSPTIRSALWRSYAEIARAAQPFGFSVQLVSSSTYAKPYAPKAWCYVVFKFELDPAWEPYLPAA